MESLLLFLFKVGAAVAVALLFGLAVFIHEFGHYLAARRLGLKVEVFSIGFGPAIWKWRRGGIEYRICWIPVGGYVALPQLDPSGMENIQGAPAGDAGGTRERLPDIPAWRRMIVALAGPFGNLALAVALAWLLYFLPNVNVGGPDTVVGEVEEGSAAAEAGFLPDDQILAVNGTRVASWSDFLTECHLGGDPENGVQVAVSRQGAEIELSARVAKSKDLLRIPGLNRKEACIVGAVIENSPAAEAGLKPGDILVAMDGAALSSQKQMAARVAAADGRPATFSIRRGTQEFDVSMTPRFNEEAGRALVGTVFADPDAHRSPWLVYRDPWRQLKADVGSIARIFRALLAPKAKGEAGRAAGGLSGPVVVFFLLWTQVMSGLVNALAFLRFLCVNLALLNLLPLPVLDGGHVLFALWEMATRRKPHPKFVSVVTNIFAFLLIGLMAVLVFRDILNLGRIFRRDESSPVAAPEPQPAVAPETQAEPPPADR